MTVLFTGLFEHALIGGITLKQKIVVYNRLEAPVLHKLQEKYEVHFFKDIDTKTDSEFIAHLADTDALIGLELPVDRELLDHAPNVKIVSNVSVGYNNLDIDELTKRGIMATNTPGILTDTVADTMMTILLATARRVPELDHWVKQGHWEKMIKVEHYGIDVHHKTLGIIGMGRIGEAIAQRAHFGFNMDILYHNRSRKPEVEEKFNATYCALDDLLMQADFICLMTPLTPETIGLLGEREFKLMKQSAIFINGSRGKTIVEADLIEALQNGEIAAAGLDVFEEEPVHPNNPLLKMKNVVTVPHIGSSTWETELKMSELAAHNLELGLEGKCPPNLINKRVWEMQK